MTAVAALLVAFLLQQVYVPNKLQIVVVLLEFLVLPVFAFAQQNLVPAVFFEASVASAVLAESASVQPQVHFVPQVLFAILQDRVSHRRTW